MDNKQTSRDMAQLEVSFWRATDIALATFRAIQPKTCRELCQKGLAQEDGEHKLSPCNEPQDDTVFVVPDRV